MLHTKYASSSKSKKRRREEAKPTEPIEREKVAKVDLSVVSNAAEGVLPMSSSGTSQYNKIDFLTPLWMDVHGRMNELSTSKIGDIGLSTEIPDPANSKLESIQSSPVAPTAIFSSHLGWDIESTSSFESVASVK